MKLHRPLVEAVIDLLHAIFVDGHQADHAVAKALSTNPRWGSRDRKFVANAVYDCVRWWRKYWVLAGLPDEEHRSGISRERVWLVWAASCLRSGHPLPTFPECQPLATLAQKADSALPLEITTSLPPWLYAMGLEQLGSSWPTIATALNAPAPVFIRVNTLRTTLPALSKLLSAADLHPQPVPDHPHALTFPTRPTLTGLPSFKDGLFEIQDAGSQRISPLLAVEPGMTVIDACAGAGGKSLHLAALMENSGRIIALDVRSHALAKLRERAARAGATNIQTLDASAENPPSADAVLLDVPCSGLGTLRRHPWAKWQLTPDTIAQLLITQHSLLRSRSLLVKPGGTLVYATCSILPSENQQAVQAFLHTTPGWELEAELHIPPTPGDGYYAARLRKK